MKHVTTTLVFEYDELCEKAQNRALNEYIDWFGEDFKEGNEKEYIEQAKLGLYYPNGEIYIGEDE